MSEYLIFHVQCSVENIACLKYHLIQCDMLVLLQEESVIHTTAELNPCCFPNTVLRLAHQQRMKQIILTSCSVVMETEDKTSFLLPLTPTPNDFWLEDGMIQSDLHLDFSIAVRMLDDRRVINLLNQPLPDEFDNEQEFMDNKKVEDESSVSALSNNEDAKVDARQQQQGLSPLELYLQQEASKNDRLIGFLVIATIVFLTIFGFVGYRIIPKTNHTSNKAEKFKKAWKAKQQVRRQNRLTYEKPFLLKPTEAAMTNPKTIKLEPKVTPNRPMCISPPRPPKSPPRIIATTTPRRILSSEKNPSATSFEDELKAKLDKTSVSVNKAPLSAPVSWEDLM